MLKSDEVLGFIDYEINDVPGTPQCEARFSLIDDAYLCKQLLLYGKDVEIIEPKGLRDTMVDMLRESLGVYEG